jgi:hypothetical protein
VSFFSEGRYGSNGRESALLQRADGEYLQVEAHEETIALLWTTSHDAQPLFEGMRALLPAGGQATIGVVKGGRLEIDESEAEPIIAALASGFAPWRFVRLDYEDRAMTWDPEVRPISSAATGPVGELGILAEGFDLSYLASLVNVTATQSIRADFDSLISRVRDITVGYPEIDLYPQH